MRAVRTSDGRILITKKNGLVAFDNAIRDAVDAGVHFDDMTVEDLFEDSERVDGSYILISNRLIVGS